MMYAVVLLEEGSVRQNICSSAAGPSSSFVVELPQVTI
jgi:hypothetical protein